MNPILVMCLGLGYFFNMYRGRPLVREGGVVIMSHPTTWESPRCTIPATSTSSSRCWPTPPTRWRSRPATRSSTPRTSGTGTFYRTSYAYHGVHPFYMWYWGCHGLAHTGKVIVVGGETRSVRRLGFTPASTLADALEMAEDVVGRHATITHVHNPPLVMADVK